MWITISILAIILLADQISKYLIEINIRSGQIVDAIPNFLQFTKVYNTGAGWSMLSDATWLLALISLVATVVIGYFVLKNDWKKKKMYSISTTLLLAGTFGNLIDRFIAVVYPQGREGVIDMVILVPLDVTWKAITGSAFPIWNIADASLVIGVICLIIYVIFFQGKEAKDA